MKKLIALAVLVSLTSILVSCEFNKELDTFDEIYYPLQNEICDMEYVNTYYYPNGTYDPLEDADPKKTLKEEYRFHYKYYNTDENYKLGYSELTATGYIYDSKGKDVTGKLYKDDTDYKTDEGSLIYFPRTKAINNSISFNGTEIEYFCRSELVINNNNNRYEIYYDNRIRSYAPIYDEYNNLYYYSIERIVVTPYLSYADFQEDKLAVPVILFT